MHKLPYEKFNEKYGAKSEEELRRYADCIAFPFVEPIVNNVDLEMVPLPSGVFTIGSPENEGYEDERPQHEVTIPGFFIGKYPITQAQWAVIASLPKVERGLNLDPSCFKGNDRPVERISWYDAVEFCQRLSRETGRAYRLPSEAEWEYACRAGSESKWCFGNNENELKDYAWYANNSNAQTHPVGEKKSNQWGLYDIYGQVWEWCADERHDDYEGKPTDRNENLFPLRGGSWVDGPDDCRSASRVNDIMRGDRFNNVGFRVLCGFERTL